MLLQAHLAGGRSHEAVIADDLMTEESLRSRDFTLPYSTRPLSLLTQVTLPQIRHSSLVIRSVSLLTQVTLPQTRHLSFYKVMQSADSGDFTAN